MVSPDNQSQDKMADIPEKISTDPNEMLALGRRHLAVKDFSAAVTSLGKACELLALQFGQTADECGEAYFWYGKALLGLAREESGVLGDKIPGGEENQDDDDEDDEVEDDNTENEKDETEEKTEADVNKETTEVQDDSVKENDEEMNLDTKASSSSSNEPQPGSSTAVPSTAPGGENTENEEEDEIENLQLAWEIFELARDVFIKRGDNGKKELADVYLHLGEVSLESEMYDKAVLDMGKSLELFSELYKPDDRRIAETHYQIGLAHSLSNGFDDAIQHFKSAAEILENRIENLKNPSASEDTDIKKKITSDPFYSIEGEIKELIELLPEIKEKIQDMIDYKTEAINSVKESLGLNKSNGGSVFKENGNKSSEEKPATDISHLIKRKRKADDVISEDCTVAKRSAT